MKDHKTSNFDIITGYLNAVFLLRTIRQQIAWNNRHGLPVMMMEDERTRLRADIMRFDDVIDRIPDRAARNAILCRYALGMSISEAAVYLGVSTGTVNRLTATGRRLIEQEQPERISGADQISERWNR